MFPKRFSVCALLAAVAILVVGCSSGGGRQSTPTTLSATTTTTSVGGTGIADGAGPIGPPVTSHVVADLGPCPKSDPSQAPFYSPITINAGVAGLFTKMVPIDVTSVRICRYASTISANGTPWPLVASGLLGPPAAGEFAAETNRPQTHRFGPLDACPTYSPLLFVTLASPSQKVWLVDQCDVITNGRLAATPTFKWFSEVQSLAVPSFSRHKTVSPS